MNPLLRTEFAPVGCTFATARDRYSDTGTLAGSPWVMSGLARRSHLFGWNR